MAAGTPSLPTCLPPSPAGGLPSVHLSQEWTLGGEVEEEAGLGRGRHHPPPEVMAQAPFLPAYPEPGEDSEPNTRFSGLGAVVEHRS